jgi:hypothetical protein
MLDSNQRLPPCKFGQSFSGRFCSVGKSRLYKQFLAFLAPLFSCSVRVCPTSVAARLQHLILPRPAPFSPTPLGAGSTLVRESCAARCAEQASPYPKDIKRPEPLKDPGPLSMSSKLPATCNAPQPPPTVRLPLISGCIVQ